jgi:hypothetical protein
MDNAKLIESLRNDLRQNAKTSADADNILVTAKLNASIARQLRVLRGHGDLFKPETPNTQPEVK